MPKSVPSDRGEASAAAAHKRIEALGEFVVKECREYWAQWGAGHPMDPALAQTMDRAHALVATVGILPAPLAEIVAAARPVLRCLPEDRKAELRAALDELAEHDRRAATAGGHVATASPSLPDAWRELGRALAPLDPESRYRLLLKGLRADRGMAALSTTELARHLGVPRTTLDGWFGLLSSGRRRTLAQVMEDARG